MSERSSGIFSLIDLNRNVVEALLEKLEAVTIERIKWFMQLEQTPYTLNTHYFESYREKYIESLQVKPSTPEDQSVMVCRS